MTDRNVYALNTVSNTVAKVDAELLKHPTFSKTLIEVENPDACIECGEQPDDAVAVTGEAFDLRRYDEPEDTEEMLDTDEPEPFEGEK